MAVDRDLLFGIIALQVGLIDQGQLVAAFQAWARDKSRPMADHLIARGDLEADQRTAIEAMVGLHLKKHGGDAGKSLASLPVGRSTLDRIEALKDPDLTATVARLGPGSGSAPTEPGADATLSYAVGSASAGGQRFRVLRPHARGGLGAVFVAVDGELNREVALKQILDHHADDPGVRQRFLLEAEITGGLEHPGIVPVYGLGSHPDGRPFYAMRFIRGDSLKDAIERFHADASLKSDPGRRSLELRKLLRRFTDVCNAIEYAHTRGVLHRDIKPGNIIVGKHGETLVVDWGLARARGSGDGVGPSEERTLAPRSAVGSSETLPGQALGTPSYMSPEQARGDLEALGPASDVYGLGATLYALLTGRAPFGGDDVAEILRLVQAGEFPRLRKVDPSIDPALEAVCLKAMATRPEGRYPSCRALADDVERWMADEPVLARREPMAARARRWVNRNRTPVAAGVVGLMVAVVGLVEVLTLQSRANARLAEELARTSEARDRETEARSRAEARFELARDAVEAFYTGASQDVILMQPGLKDLRRRLLTTALDFYRRFADEEAAAPTSTQNQLYDVAASIRKVAQIQHQIGDYEGAEASYRRALEAFAKAPWRTSRLELPQWHQHIADTLMARGKPEEALRETELALGLIRDGYLDPNSSQAHRFEGFALLALGKLQWRLGRADEALETLEESRRHLQTVLDMSLTPDEGEEGPVPEIWAIPRIDLVGAVEAIGDVHLGLGRPAEAIPRHDQAREHWEIILTLPPSGEADTYALEAYRDGALASLGRDLVEAGRPDEGLPKLRAAVDGLEATFSGRMGDPVVRRKLALARIALARILAPDGDPAEATLLLDRAEELLRGLDPMTPEDRGLGAVILALRSTLAGRAASEAGATAGGPAEAETDRLASEAVSALREAVSAGFRCSPLLRSDPAFDPIRDRDDFRGLVEDLAPPAVPSPLP